MVTAAAPATPCEPQASSSAGWESAVVTVRGGGGQGRRVGGEEGSGVGLGLWGSEDEGGQTQLPSCGYHTGSEFKGP